MEYYSLRRQSDNICLKFMDLFYIYICVCVCVCVCVFMYIIYIIICVYLLYTYGDEDKYIKTKIKIYGGIVNTNVPEKTMPKEKAPCNCLSMTMLDCVIKTKKKYYPQTLLEECKYEQKRLKTENLIDDDLEESLSDNDYNDEMESDDESSE